MNSTHANNENLELVLNVHGLNMTIKSVLILNGICPIYSWYCTLDSI